MTHAAEIIPSGQALGAELRNLDLRNLSDSEFDSIHDAWLNHLVVLLRAQQLTDEDLIRFSRRLGNLDWAPVQETGRRFVDGHPEIYVVSNVIENGEPIGSLGDGEELDELAGSGPSLLLDDDALHLGHDGGKAAERDHG